MNINNLIDYAIAYNKANRNTSFVKEHRKLTNYIEYLKNCCTVGLQLPRRCGKTSYILERATEYDIVVVPNMAIKREMYRNCAAKVLTYDEATNIRAYGLFDKVYCNIVYFDEPYMLHNTYERVLDSFIINNISFDTVVLLGT
jgi:hypothetical protein